MLMALLAATPLRAATLLRDAGMEYGLTQLAAPPPGKFLGLSCGQPLSPTRSIFSSIPA